MSTSLYINRGISNYSNFVRSNLQNPVQKSEVKKPKFDVHDRLVYGDARDRLYIARMRELEIKRKRNEISQLSYDAYVKNLKNESINEEHEFMEDDNEEHENIKSNDDLITQKLTDKTSLSLEVQRYNLQDIKDNSGKNWGVNAIISWKF